jgi:hypothetical protein
VSSSLLLLLVCWQLRMHGTCPVCGRSLHVLAYTTQLFKWLSTGFTPLLCAVLLSSALNVLMHVKLD